jgi:hypothetical protein
MSSPIVIESIKQIRSILDEEGPSDTGLERIADSIRWLVAHSDEVIAAENDEPQSQTSQD